MDRRFLRASLVGATVGVALFVGILTRGTGDLFEWQRDSDFYDAQAHAWLDGHWHIDPSVLGIERFEARGRSYMYQGPVPALLRVPVAAVTHRLDGRLTEASMLLALLVASAFVVRLHWRVRTAVRGPAALGTGEAVTVALATFAATGGTVLLFIASRAWVYHEAIMWGVALTLGGLDALLACTRGPTPRRIAWAGLLATLAVSSRASVGIGVVAGLGLLTVGQALHVRRRRRTGRDLGEARRPDRLRWLGPGVDDRGRHHVVALATATVVPVLAYAAVNWIKFRSLFSVPFASQGISLVDPVRRHFLEQNGGTLFGLQFVPTTLAQYLRPEALRLTGAFPFVDFASPLSPIGHVTFDLIDWSGSLPTTLPALLIASLVGGWAVARGRVRATIEGEVVEHDLTALRVPALSGLAAGLTILPFGYIAQRYVADLLPVTVLLGLIGLHVLWARAGATRWPTVALGVLAAAVLAGTWANLSVALLYQRLYSPNVPSPVMAAFLDTRYDVPQSLGLDPAIPMRTGERLPADGSRGDLFVIGDCDALYLNDGVRVDAIHSSPWNPVERGRRAGHFVLDVSVPALLDGQRQPLLSIETGDAHPGLIWVEQAGGSRALGFGGAGFAARSGPLSLQEGRTHRIELTVDARLRQVQARVDGKEAFSSILGAELDPTFTVGRNTVGDPAVDDAFGGRIGIRPDHTPVCEELRREAQRSR
jgi:hypothetical protein